MSKEFSSNYHWYAIYTNSRAEKKVLLSLTSKGIEAYLPLKKVLKQWSDRKKWVEEPAISSYVFVRVSEKEYLEVLNVRAVVRYVFFEKKAAVIPDYQIDVMKKIVNGNLNYEVSTRVYKEGDKVVLQYGPLKGLTGMLVMHNKGKKILIRIDQIAYSLLLDLQDVSIIKLIK